jgi:hypothetical protein
MPVHNQVPAKPAQRNPNIDELIELKLGYAAQKISSAASSSAKILLDLAKRVFDCTRHSRADAESEPLTNPHSEATVMAAPPAERIPECPAVSVPIVENAEAPGSIFPQMVDVATETIPTITAAKRDESPVEDYDFIVDVEEIRTNKKSM